MTCQDMTPGLGHDQPAGQALELAKWVREAGERTLHLLSDLTDEQLLGPYIKTVNPMLWEIGHVAWFQEKWVLRHACGQSAVRPDADRLYDSTGVAHTARWGLPLPTRRETLAYKKEVAARVLERLDREDLDEDLAYFVRLSVFHEDMHTEAFTYTRQTLVYPAPRPMNRAEDEAVEWAIPFSTRSTIREARSSRTLGDAEVPGGTFLLGAERGEPFTFDNEKWAHPVEVEPFAIAKVPVTQREFAAFVDEGGYARRRFWSDGGWRWREAVRAVCPVYWQCTSTDGWERRCFDTWIPLEPDQPVVHVNWYEADAYCRWAGRRLPSELEWEVAAAAEPCRGAVELLSGKRRFPWGDQPPDSRRAHLDWGWGQEGARCSPIAVNALPEGDSAFGCRQMIGNVWEWTSSAFQPYPGFAPDPYKEYSQPWFGTHKVLRGGCWATRARLLRNTWRNFYQPDRRDVWAGFRTCAATE